MRLPIPTVPVSTQSVGQFEAPNAAPMQDAGPQQMQQLGASLMTAGAAAARIGVDVQQDLDQGFLMESDAVASELVRGVVGGYRQKTGLAAIEQFQDTQTSLRDQMRNLSESARSPRQKQALERMLAQRMQDASESMASHRDVQARNRAIGGAEAGVLASLNDYQAAIGNPEDMALAREVAMQRTAELSRLRGEDGDMAKLAMLDTTTRMHLMAAQSLVTSGHPDKAGAYLEQSRDEIAGPEYQKAMATTRAAAIEEGARRLTEQFPTLQERTDWVDGMETLTPEEKDQTKRHLLQLENVRDAIEAKQANDVEAQVRQWMAQNPRLELSDNPELAREAARLGVSVRRVPTTDAAWLDRFYASAPAELDQFRAMDDNQLRRALRPHLDDHDLGMVTKFLRGDQSGTTIDQHTKMLARAIGLLPNGDRADAAETQAFMAWKANTIDPLAKAKRDELKRDLTPTEFDELIVQPILKDRVLVQTFSPLFGVDALAADEPMTVMQAQRGGDLPMERDDPSTTGLDESAYTERHQNVYVNTISGPVYLRDIPMQVRRDLRQAFQELHPGQQMTARQEAEEWVAKGRPGGPEERKRIAAKDDPTIRRYRDSQMGMSQDFWQKAVRNYREAKQ